MEAGGTGVGGEWASRAEDSAEAPPELVQLHLSARAKATSENWGLILE